MTLLITVLYNLMLLKMQVTSSPLIKLIVTMPIKAIIEVFCNYIKLIDSLFLI